MYIGKLDYTQPALPICVKWDLLWAQPYKFKLVLEDTCFVDRVTLTFGEKNLLKEVKAENYGVHTAETGNYITSNKVTLLIGDLCKELAFTVQADYSDIELKDITVYGATNVKTALFPTPESAEFGENLFPVSNYMTFSSALSLKAEAVLCEKWAEITGLTLEKTENGAVQFIKGNHVANGYGLKVSKNQITLSAADERGFVMAVETLIKLISNNNLPDCEINDAPAHPFRGAHIMLPATEHMDFAKRFIKHLISPMGYNAVIIEVAGGMRYDSHPLINQKVNDAIAKGEAGIWPAFPHSCVAGGQTVEKDTVRDFVDYIRSFGIEVIPEIQSLGHVQYMTVAYPEIAEIDEEEESIIDTRYDDTRPKKFYHHCFCPSNPRSYEILFDIIDEVVEVFRPTEYVHMGHDEVYEIGVCKTCRGKSPADLFAYDVNKIYDYLKQKGLKMMIWADLLQPFKYRAHTAASKIPKDIVMLDFIWYFHLDKDIEDNLLANGFKTAIGNLYSSHFPRYNSRVSKSGMIGGQTSAWVGTHVNDLAQEGKLFDFRLTAQMLWSKHYRPEYTNVYTDMILKQTPALREKLEKITLPSIRGSAQSVDPKNICKVADSLRIRHALITPIAKQPWIKGPRVGEYLLTYADGTKERFELFAGWNIDIDRRPYGPNPNKIYRHTGYAADYFCIPAIEGGQYFEIPLLQKELLSAELIEEDEIKIKVYDTEIITEK